MNLLPGDATEIFNSSRKFIWCIVTQANQQRAYWHVWFNTSGCIRKWKRALCFLLVEVMWKTSREWSKASNVMQIFVLLLVCTHQYALLLLKMSWNFAAKLPHSSQINFRKSNSFQIWYVKMCCNRFDVTGSHYC